MKPKSLRKLVVYCSDVRVMHSICRAIDADASTLPPMSRQGGFSAFDHLGVNLPKQVSCPSEVTDRQKYGEDFCKVMNEVDHLWGPLITTLSKKYPNVEFRFQLDRSAGVNYYNGPCFKMRGQNSDEQVFSLADGGRVDWINKLTRVKKDRMISSGVGLELLEKQFK